MFWGLTDDIEKHSDVTFLKKWSALQDAIVFMNSHSFECNLEDNSCMRWIAVIWNHPVDSHSLVLKVAIVAQDLAAFHSTSPEIGHQQHGHHLVTTEARPVTLLATSNGTQIAVQVKWKMFFGVYLASRAASSSITKSV